MAGVLATGPWRCKLAVELEARTPGTSGLNACSVTLHNWDKHGYDTARHEHEEHVRMYNIVNRVSCESRHFYCGGGVG
jgi:hypothetical protein